MYINRILFPTILISGMFFSGCASDLKWIEVNDKGEVTKSEPVETKFKWLDDGNQERQRKVPNKETETFFDFYQKTNENQASITQGTNNNKDFGFIPEESNTHNYNESKDIIRNTFSSLWNDEDEIKVAVNEINTLNNISYIVNKRDERVIHGQYDEYFKLKLKGKRYILAMRGEINNGIINKNKLFSFDLYIAEDNIDKLNNPEPMSTKYSRIYESRLFFDNYMYIDELRKNVYALNLDRFFDNYLNDFTQPIEEVKYREDGTLNKVIIWDSLNNSSNKKIIYKFWKNGKKMQTIYMKNNILKRAIEFNEYGGKKRETFYKEGKYLKELLAEEIIYKEEGKIYRKKRFYYNENDQITKEVKF